MKIIVPYIDDRIPYKIKSTRKGNFIVAAIIFNVCTSRTSKEIRTGQAPVLHISEITRERKSSRMMKEEEYAFRRYYFTCSSWQRKHEH